MTRSGNAPSTPSRHRALPSAASFALLLCSALSAGEALAQDWQRIGPDGGVVYSLEVPDPAGNRAYAIGHGGLFRSDDRGATWSLMPSPNQNQGWQNFPLHGFSRSDPDAVVVGRGDAVWRSTDGGQTWRELVIIPPEEATLHRYTAIAVDPNDARHIAVFMVAVVDQGYGQFPFSALWLTEDGETPTVLEHTVNRDPKCHGIVSNSFNHVNMAAFLNGELYYHHIYTCQSWGPASLPERYLLRWNHPMYHWLPPSSTTPWRTIPGRMVATDQAVFFSNWGGSVYRLDSVDGPTHIVRGSSWALQAAGDGSLIAGASTGLHRSIDHGNSWQLMDESALGVPASDMSTGPVAAVFSSPTRWLAGSSDGVYQSNNPAGPWLRSSNGFTGFPARTIAIDPGNEQRIWAGSFQIGRVLFRTSDGGGDWQASDLPLIASQLRSIMVDPATTAGSGQTTVYATGIGCFNSRNCPGGTVGLPGIFRSTNSGTNWQSISGDLPTALAYFDVRQVALVGNTTSPQPRLLLTGRQSETGLVTQSHNEGQNWSSSSNGLPARGDDVSASDALDIRPAPSDSLRIYLATVASPFNPAATEVQRNGVFRSDDGGATWTHRSHGLPLRPGASSHGGAIRLAVHPNNPDVVWAITTVNDAESPYTTRYRVYHTGNGGLDWSERSTGLGTEQQHDIAVDPDNPGRLYLASVNGVFHSDNGGASWQRLGSHVIGAATGLAVGPHHLFAGTYQGVVKIPKPGTGDPIFSHGFEPASGH